MLDLLQNMEKNKSIAINFDFIPRENNSAFTICKKLFALRRLKQINKEGMKTKLTSEKPASLIDDKEAKKERDSIR